MKALFDATLTLLGDGRALTADQISHAFRLPDQAIALCGRVPEWSNEEPTPIYE